MRYFLFLDESGEASITNPDPRFNIFVLCGVLFAENDYTAFNAAMKELKTDIFGDPNIVFHSFEMRKQSGIFKVFRDRALLDEFYKRIELIFTTHNYKIVACIVNKEKYKERYPEKNQAYEDALKFICERCIRFIGGSKSNNILHICLEKRQKQKDSYLKKYYTNFKKYGTEYVSTADFEVCMPLLHFRGKQQNINGLEFADLCAYPIARKALCPDIVQPTFEIFKNKIMTGFWGQMSGVGLKYFP